MDLVVVFLFTHPLISLLSRSRAFGSARFTGLDALRGQPIADPVEPAAKAPARAPLSASGGVKLEKAPAAVAVLEPEDEAPAGGPDEDLQPKPERRRTVPEPGSAAERAAARRAKMRDGSPSADGEGDR